MCSRMERAPPRTPPRCAGRRDASASESCRRAARYCDLEMATKLHECRRLPLPAKRGGVRGGALAARANTGLFRDLRLTVAPQPRRKTYPRLPFRPYHSCTPAHGRADDHGLLWEREGGPAVMSLTSSKPRAVIARLLSRETRRRQTERRPLRGFRQRTRLEQTETDSRPPARHYDRARSIPDTERPHARLNSESGTR